jgi:hypothetical protein
VARNARSRPREWWRSWPTGSQMFDPVYRVVSVVVGLAFIIVGLLTLPSR